MEEAEWLTLLHCWAWPWMGSGTSFGTWSAGEPNAWRVIGAAHEGHSVWPGLLSSWAWCSVPEPCAEVMRAVMATVDSAVSCFKGCIVWDFGSLLHLIVPGSFTEELIPALFGNWWYWRFKMNLIMYVKASFILILMLINQPSSA